MGRILEGAAAVCARGKAFEYPARFQGSPYLIHERDYRPDRNMLQEIIGPDHIDGIVRIRNPGQEIAEHKMSIVHSGENNSMYGKKGHLSPRWKGGVSKLRDLIESSYQYHAWRKGVFARDGYKCQQCGGGKSSKRGGYEDIHAHHKTSLAEIIINNYESLREGNYDIPELVDIDNGITLCMECHISLHKERIAVNAA